MKPSKLIPGQKIKYLSSGGQLRDAIFIKRFPGRGAYSLVKFPDYVGLNGPDDEGICQISDYDLSRKGV